MQPTSDNVLSVEQARSFYDRLGSKQDLQFYENPVIDALIERGRFSEAHAVFELGFGTGKLAVRLLERVLPADARYVGVDISPVMLALARGRLAPFGERVEVRLSEGASQITAPPHTFDRFLSTYVLDLMAPEHIRAMLGEAHRLLGADGLLCLAGLTQGTTLASRAVCRLWNGVHRLSPRLVGGCRPIQLLSHLPPGRWKMVHHEVLVSWGVSSEILVAAPLGSD